MLVTEQWEDVPTIMLLRNSADMTTAVREGASNINIQVFGNLVVVYNGSLQKEKPGHIWKCA